MRVEIHAAVDLPPQSSAQLTEVIRTRVTKILTDHHKSVPVLTMEGDTAVISGVAASESDRNVIAMLVSLEPGVRNVRNEMTVAGQPAATAPVVPASGS
jgi:hypothetical protein